MLKHLKRRFRWYYKYKKHATILENSIKKISESSPPSIAENEMIVLLLVRNGETRIAQFIEHHLDIGAKHIVVLDNESIDRTAHIAAQYDGVTIYQTGVSYKDYSQFMRAWLQKTFCDDGWVLVMDVDEKFRYPLDSQITLKQFLLYLNTNKFTAVQAEMLDLFSLVPASQWLEDGYAEWYDLSDVEWISTPARRYAVGGIRKTAFGVKPFLTKYPLIRFSKGARKKLTDSHNLYTGKVADITTLLEHYKFDTGFAQYCEEAVREGNYWNNSIEYQSYLRGVSETKDFVFQPQNPQQFTGIDKLIDEGFVVISPAYMEYANQLSEKNVP